MTINVGVKCPDGIVMGSDSLSTIEGFENSYVAMPYMSKLVPLGRFSRGNYEGYSAGAMSNGDGIIGGRTIEDIIAEFSETHTGHQPTGDYNLEVLSTELAEMIQNLVVDASKKSSYVRNFELELIIGGYSKGSKSRKRRYGEIYSILWKNEDLNNPYPRYKIQKKLHEDSQYGTIYGGQPRGLDRFFYGIDDWIIEHIWYSRERLFYQVRDYIINELRNEGIIIPNDIQLRVPGLLGFDVYSILSNYERGNVETEVENLDPSDIKENAIGAIQRMERFFSLQTAVNYCTFLLSCAYAEHVFTSRTPKVGSEMRIATITRDEGFEFTKIWRIQSPGPPFR